MWLEDWNQLGAKKKKKKKKKGAAEKEKKPTAHARRLKEHLDMMKAKEVKSFQKFGPIARALGCIMIASSGSILWINCCYVM